MKIDWSKWYFIKPAVANTSYYIINPAEMYVVNTTENVSIPIVFDLYNKEINTDDPDKWLKTQCKNAVRRYYVEQRLRQLTDQKIPIEDNLDYIENEAEKRGLI